MNDRKKYWNEEYTEYWKKVTEEAENKEITTTKIKKTTEGDCKSTGKTVAYELFDELTYNEYDKVLDYGCGFGRFVEYFKDKTNYYGIDISEAMIKECIRIYPDIREQFMVSEGENLPYKDGFFNKIICYGVFDACYQEKALAEMFRVLAIDGEIIITGKNYSYMIDDNLAYDAEKGAREKGHPNYFTDVNNLLEQLSEIAIIKKEKYFLRRGDFTNNIYVNVMPKHFYEYALILKKKRINYNEINFSKFSYKYSKTWREIN